MPVSYTQSDAADDLLCVDLGGRRIIKKKKKKKEKQIQIYPMNRSIRAKRTEIIETIASMSQYDAYPQSRQRSEH